MSTKDVAGIVLFFLFSFSSLQAQIFVDADATGANNGTSWADAFTELHAATALAGYGAQIWIAEGTYHPTAGTDRNISFQIDNGVEIYGGFAGGETSISQRDWVANPTILSGDIGTAGTKNDNSYVIVNYPNSSTTGKMDGVIIQDGYADGTYQINGAGILINAFALANDGAIQFSNIVFQNNYASGSGGAVYMEAGNGGSLKPNFELCQFLNNASGSSGGAVYHSAYNNGSITSTFSKCTFFQNMAMESGAGVFNHGGNGGNCVPSFTHCDFEANASDNGHGGALYNLGTGEGGNASPIIVNSRFFNNSGFAAGAIYNNGTNKGNSSPQITNSTFVGNYINEKGAAGGGGGIIYNNGSVNGSSNTIVTNSIIWGNKVDGDNTHVFKNVEGTPTISYSLIDAGDCSNLNYALGSTTTCGPGMQYNIDPLFVNEGGGDLRLQVGSPAINTGDNTINPVVVDLDGVSRVMYSVIDKGAYESFAVVLPVELINFQAETRGDEVVLNWATASEINNDYFTIERSIDGVSFESIAEIKGAGNSNATLDYETIDASPIRGTNYYRLIQTDFDGTTIKSHTVNVVFEKGETSVFPNPVTTVLYVTTENFKNHEVEYGIYDILGNEISRQKIEVWNGRFEINEVKGLSTGTYFIKVLSQGEDAFVQKIQKL